jgi:hypothetical protein
MATACSRLSATRPAVLNDLNGERGSPAWLRLHEPDHRAPPRPARAFLYPSRPDNVTVLVNTQSTASPWRTVPWAWRRAERPEPTFGAHREVIRPTGGFNTPGPSCSAASATKRSCQFRDPVRHSPSGGNCRTTCSTVAACTKRRNRSSITRRAQRVGPTTDSLELPDVSIVEIELYASDTIAKIPGPPNTGPWRRRTGVRHGKVWSANPDDRPIGTALPEPSR